MTDNEIKKRATQEGYNVTDEMLSFARWLLMATRRDDLALQTRNVMYAIEKEREDCAKLCESRYMGDNNREDMEAKRCAAAIRARNPKY